MYRIIESILKMKFKDNEVKKASITRTAQTTTVELFFSITIHYES